MARCFFFLLVLLLCYTILENFVGVMNCARAFRLFSLVPSGRPGLDSVPSFLCARDAAGPFSTAWGGGTHASGEMPARFHVCHRQLGGTTIRDQARWHNTNGSSMALSSWKTHSRVVVKPGRGSIGLGPKRRKGLATVLTLVL